MKVTVTTLNDTIFNLDVSEDIELENFKAFCAVESDLPQTEIVIVLNGLPLIGDQKSLKDHGVKDGDVVILQHHRTAPARSRHANPGHGQGHAAAAPAAGRFPNFDFSGIHVPGRTTGGTPRSRPHAPTVDQDDPAYIRDQLLASPEQLALLKQNNPPLSDALHSGDFEKFSKMIREMQKSHKDREAQRLRLLTADSMDVEAQRLIEDEIRQKQVDANMEAAMEFNPESFGTVCMLYINCKVNGVPVKAFIDSGAQTTIMSTECAERCKIMRLVDTRFSGIAKGVGTQKIIGRIHMVQIQIANDFFVSSFSILGEQKMDMLLGLDLLRRHQCVIDLQRNCLVIGTTATEAPFLPESELPESARLTGRSESLKEHEAAMDALGSEDAGLAHAIEQSVKDQQNKAGASSSNAPSSIGGTGDNAAALTINSTDKFTEADVAEIVRLGYPQHQVMFELRRFDGDKIQAIAALIAKSFLPTVKP